MEGRKLKKNVCQGPMFHLRLQSHIPWFISLFNQVSQYHVLLTLLGVSDVLVIRQSLSPH